MRNILNNAKLPPSLSNSAIRMFLELFENRVLRRIFGPKREEVAGSSRKLYK
jgi:hypothetical protein